jgi:hypothetical protein
MSALGPKRICHDVLAIVSPPEEVNGASVTLSQKVMRGEDLLVETT